MSGSVDESPVANHREPKQSPFGMHVVTNTELLIFFLEGVADKLDDDLIDQSDPLSAILFNCALAGEDFDGWVIET